jgi:hypothetical protein
LRYTYILIAVFVNVFCNLYLSGFYLICFTDNQVDAQNKH